MPERMIEIRGYFTLGERMRGKRRVSADRDWTVSDLREEMGLTEEEVGFTMVNGCWADPASEVLGGDRVAFFPEYVPYHKVYGMCVL